MQQDPAYCAHLLTGIYREIDRHMLGAELIDLAGGYLTLDPGRQSDYPSTNHNQAKFLGSEQEPRNDELDEIAVRFGAADVSKWFLWLSPCPYEERIRSWITRTGLSRFQGTGYPTLIYTGDKLPKHDTTLLVRQVEKGTLSGYRDDLLAFYGEFSKLYLDTCGKPGFHHYVALDGQRPVSAAVLYVKEAAALLMLAGTAEGHRSRGGQSALIVERVNKALDLGCERIFTETLYMLKTSLGNLRRKGFEIVYEKEVYSSWKIEKPQ